MDNTKDTIEDKHITIDELGGMICRLETRLENKIESSIKELEIKMNFRFDGIQRQVDNICLNYTPYREHNLLRDRVKRVERKVGIR